MLVIKARWENVVPLWKETGGVVTQDMQKAEVLYEFLPPFSLTSAPATLLKLQRAKKDWRGSREGLRKSSQDHRIS